MVVFEAILSYCCFFRLSKLDALVVFCHICLDGLADLAALVGDAV